MYRMTIVLLLLAMLASPARADDVSTPASQLPEQWSTGKKVLVVEGLAAFNAGVAAASPQLFGGFLLVVTPFACIDGTGPQGQHVAADWVACGAFATIGTYDAGIDDPQYSRPRVFAGNFAAMNLTVAVTMLTQHYAGDAAAEKVAEHFSVGTEPHGGVRVNLHWTF